jgi:hypothetical protein
MSEQSTAWIVLTDHGIAIRFERHEHHIDFRVFNVVCASYSDGKGGWKEVWQLFDGSASHALEEQAKAYWELDGSVKWDGCINWQTNPDCMAHGCGPRTVEHIRDTFASVYAYADRYFDLLGDEAPPMPEPFIEIAEEGDVTAE